MQNLIKQWKVYELERMYAIELDYAIGQSWTRFDVREREKEEESKSAKLCRSYQIYLWVCVCVYTHRNHLTQ